MMAADPHIAFIGVRMLSERCRAAVANVKEARSAHNHTIRTAVAHMENERSARNDMIRDAIKNGSMSRAEAARTAGLSKAAVTLIMLRGHDG